MTNTGKTIYVTCCACPTDKNPDTGDWDISYKHKKEIVTNDNLSHGYCPSCLDKIMVEVGRTIKQKGLQLALT